MDRHDELTWLEGKEKTLFSYDSVESLLREALEKDVQVELRQGHFNLAVARVLPDLFKRGSIDQGELGCLRVDDWPDKRLV